MGFPPILTESPAPVREVARTDGLRLLERDGKSFVERASGAVAVSVVALTEDDRLLLVEQYREALARRVIELPSGIVRTERSGEAPSGEAPVVAARRELREATSWDADRLEPLASGPTSPGLANEIVHFFLARDLAKLGPDGGIESEEILVHAIPLEMLEEWLEVKQADGSLVDSKIWVALWFLARRRAASRAR